MNAEIITTGTEILLGDIVDTNAAWMARRLKDLGINLFYKTTVGDNEDRIVAVMKQALGRSDLVLVSGGLGPTVDDVTRDAAARATDRELVLNQEALANIEAIFARWGREVHDNNRRQAYMPAGAIPIANPVGTAPGFIVEVERDGQPPALLITLPGVPREMMRLMQDTVEPFLAERLGPDRVFIRSRILRTVGIGESMIDARIDDLMRLSNPTVGLAAKLGQCDVRVAARAASEAEADAMVERVVADIRSRLGDFVYAEGDEPLEATVVRALQAAGHTLAILETNTGGEVAQRLRAVPGGDAVVRASFVVTSAAELGPGAPAELASETTARLAVRWLLHDPQAHSDANLVLAVCGTVDPAAGPYGAYRGETFVAVATEDALAIRRNDVGGVEELARRWAGNGALNFLRLWLAGK